jgi:hypothetical protein
MVGEAVGFQREEGVVRGMPLTATYQYPGIFNSTECQLTLFFSIEKVPTRMSQGSHDG